MSADYTKKPGWMRETIRALGGIGVPVLAIFPADRPYEPIVFTGGYTKSGLLEAIAQATGRAGTKTAARAGVAAASER
jgi:thiol:disulfide interchange protein